MKYYRIIVMVFLLCGFAVFSQENTIKHTVVKGETVSSIADKYNVSITSIYKLNPNAKKTLHLNQQLLIPSSDSKKKKEDIVSKDNLINVSHEVLPKETLYGLTKQYKTTIELLYSANPNLEKEGVKIGQVLVIPSNLTQNEIQNITLVSSEKNEMTTLKRTHQVKAKESLYAIAKTYGVTLKELENVNPSIGNKGLAIGQEINLPVNANPNGIQNESSNKVSTSKESDALVENAIDGNTFNETEKGNEIVSNEKIYNFEIIHEVLPKETKYGIAKKYGIKLTELEKQNPSIKQKLLVGSKLSIQIQNNTATGSSLNEVKESIVTVEDQANPNSSSANEDLINQLIETASGKIGTRYRSGGTSTAGFDCSGLMYSTFGNFDIKLPRSSIEQSNIGEVVQTENVQKGDLIFFKTNGRSRINHVGMVVEVLDDEIKFIHSSTHSGVIISSTKEPYYRKSFAQVNRVLN